MRFQESLSPPTFHPSFHPTFHTSFFPYFHLSIFPSFLPSFLTYFHPSNLHPSFYNVQLSSRGFHLLAPKPSILHLNCSLLVFFTVYFLPFLPSLSFRLLSDFLSASFSFLLLSFLIFVFFHCSSHTTFQKMTSELIVIN